MIPVDCQAILHDQRGSYVRCLQWRTPQRAARGQKVCVYWWEIDSSQTFVPTTPSYSSLCGGLILAYSGTACEARRRRCMSLALPKCRPQHYGTKVLLSWYVGRVVGVSAAPKFYVKPKLDFETRTCRIIQQYEVGYYEYAGAPSVSELWAQVPLPPLTLPVW